MLHHQAEPAQTARLDEVAVAGADRVAVDPLGLDVFAAPALDGVAEAKDDRPLWHEGVQQQPEQHTRCGTPAPGGAVEDAMIVHEPPLPAEPGHAENAGHRALARCQNGSDQQHLGMAPTPLEEQRRKAEDHFGEAGWQSELGSGPVAGTPQPNRIPAPLLQARKWPNSSLGCRLALLGPHRSWLERLPRLQQLAQTGHLALYKWARPRAAGSGR